MNPKNAQDVISLNNAVLGYNKKIIASDITLTIKKGEFIGIFGANGAGKSTFLRTLLGLIKPLAGTAWVLGATPKHGHKHIGYMPQLRSHNAVANLTSRMIIEASSNSAAYGLPVLSKQQKAEVQQVIELVNAQAYADRPFQQLSGGERQRLLLAQALLGKPPILLLDEPLSNLDPRSQETFINLLCDIQRQLSVTVLFTAHDPNPLLKVMSRVLYFAHGKVIMGTTDEIMTSAKLTELYGTAIEVIRYKERLIVLGEERVMKEQEAHHG